MSLNPLNPLFAVIVILIAYLTAYLINLKYKLENDPGRYETIDRLRGFLGIGVFIHHSSIWYHYVSGASWEAPKSNLYNQFGQASVALFFMITSFLFISKLLHSKENNFNWTSYFISRFFRLTPMYYVSLVIFFIIILAGSDWELKVSVPEFLKSIVDWGTFTIFSGSYINNYPLTADVNAWIIWTLSYEWLFYFSLPLLALFILKVKPPLFYIFASVAFVTLYLVANSGVEVEHILSFSGGAVAALMRKYIKTKIKANNIIVSCLIVIALYFVGEFNTSKNIICKLLLTFIFTAIALGNTFFGLLKSPTLKFLGDICFSTYLLHGMLLFTVFYLGFGLEKASQFSSSKFCIIIFLLTPILIIISFLGYRFIEKPFIEKAHAINERYKLS